MADLKEKFMKVLIGLFPKGYIWNFHSKKNNYKTLDPIAHELALVQDKTKDLFFEILPTKTTFFQEWEKMLALPDPGDIITADEDERRQRITTKFTSTGGQSVSYYEKQAEKLGFNISIFDSNLLMSDDFFRSGLGRCGKMRVARRDNEVIFTFIVDVYGVSDESEIIRLKAYFNKFKPAHSKIFYRLHP